MLRGEVHGKKELTLLKAPRDRCFDYLDIEIIYVASICFFIYFIPPDESWREEESLYQSHFIGSIPIHFGPTYRKEGQGQEERKREAKKENDSLLGERSCHPSYCRE